VRFGRQPGEVREAEFAHPPLGGRPVLVVESTAAAFAILSDCLSSWKLPVFQATNREAFALARNAASRGEPYGLAIVDLEPETNAVGFARALGSDPVTADLPLLVLTPFDRDLGDLGGRVTISLTKPVRRSALRDCIAAIDGDPRSLAAKAAELPPVPLEAALGTRVLMAEDNPVNLAVGIGFLDSLGCEVVTATNGIEAVEHHRKGEFSLIFMDCQMPEMDGFQATTEIRRRETARGRRTPIVALTASAVEGDRERCLVSGMDDYLPKPYTRGQLREMLKTWLAPTALLASRICDNRSTSEAATPMPIEPIDDKGLAELNQIRDLAPRAIRLFLERTPALLRRLEEGAANGDKTLLCNVSHRLKSSSAMIGAVVLSSRCQQLEMVAQAGAGLDAPALVKAIIADYDAASVALAARLLRVE